MSMRVECLQLVRKNLGLQGQGWAVRGGMAEDRGERFIHMFFSVDGMSPLGWACSRSLMEKRASSEGTVGWTKEGGYL